MPALVAPVGADSEIHRSRVGARQVVDGDLTVVAHGVRVHVEERERVTAQGHPGRVGSVGASVGEDRHRRVRRDGDVGVVSGGAGVDRALQRHGVAHGARRAGPA